jgi:hypothetical protein
MGHHLRYPLGRVAVAVDRAADVVLAEEMGQRIGTIITGSAGTVRTLPFGGMNRPFCRSPTLMTGVPKYGAS